MDNNAKIIYNGEADAVFCQDHISLTLHRDWFFSKDKKFYGVPVSFKCIDTTGDAFITISLHDINNSLVVRMSLDCCMRYNAVIGVGQNSKDSIVDVKYSVTFCGKSYLPETISIDFHSANLSETVAFDNNNKHEQDCFNNLEFIELWKLRRKSLCLDGIVLDNVLKNKLRPNGYVANRVEHSTIDPDCADLHFEKEELIYYVWCGLHVGSQTEILYYNPPEQTGG